MTAIARPLKLLAAASVLLVLMVGARPATTMTVPAGSETQRFLDAAPEGASVVLAAGEHRGPLTVDKTLTVKGEHGARVVADLESNAAVHVTARDVRISDLEVVGGWTGIELDDAAGAVVSNVRIRGSDAQGMLIYKAAATIDAVAVSELRDPYAQGIEVLSAPDVVVRNSVIFGGKVGIVSHLSEVKFENNFVTGTTLAGVVIREMSSGTASGNRIVDATGAGLYCGDESRCAFENNIVTGIATAGNARSEAGWGLVVHYKATASSKNDVLGGDAGRAITLSQSLIVTGSPLRLGDGAKGMLAAFVATLAALAVVGLLYVAARRFNLSRPSKRTYVGAAAAGTALLLVGVGVQSFHMLEHVVQLYRVRMDGLPSRGSLVGSVVDTEWVHFVYNAIVLVGFAALLLLRRRGWKPSGTNLRLGDGLILSAVLLQSYHVVEHSLKVFQHVATGAKVNPGLLGNHFDLVLLHFGVNAAIYIAFIAAAIFYLWPGDALRETLLPARSEPTPT
jgi:nitrous oxidase accessory protein NosD